MERLSVGAVLLSLGATACFSHPCEPISCAAANATCGEIDNGCGGVVECGECEGPAVCGAHAANVCSFTMDGDNCLDGWCPLNPPVPPFDPEHGGVSAIAADDVWAVGNRGAVLHYDGVSWRMISAVPHGLRDIWMAAPDDGWLVGEDATVYHWDGEAWSQMATAQTGPLRGVSGSGPDDVWIVGDVTLHWDGTTLAQVAGTPPLVHVYAAGPDAVWATGLSFSPGQDRIWRWIDGAWRDQTGGVSDDERRFNGIVGVGDAPVFAVGRTYNALSPSQSFAATWNGTRWSFRSPGSFDEPDPSLLDVFLDGVRPVAVGSDGAFRLDENTLLASPVPLRVGAAADGRWFAFGDLGETLSSDGVSWRDDRAGVHDPMVAIGDAGADVWIAGDGVLLQWTAGTLVEHRPAPEYFYAVAGTSATDVWATGSDFTHVWHWDGALWTSVATPADMVVATVVARADGLVLLVGSGIYRWDGAGWAVDLAAEPNEVWQLAAAGDGDEVWAVNNDPASPRVARRSAGGWSDVTRPPSLPCAIDAGADGEVWIAGADLRFWDGSGWTPIAATPVTAPTCALAVRSDAAWIVDATGAVFRHDAGGQWVAEWPTREGFLSSLHAGPSGIWAAGDDGVVLHRP